MKVNEKSVRGNVQDILCPFKKLCITQGTGINGNTYSHNGTRAIDTTNGDGTRAPYYAPFDLVCVKTYPNMGGAIWQSKNKVRFADGTIDYCSISTNHDNSFNGYVGLELLQGEQLGNMGDAGQATGIHCHIEFSKGKNGLIQNSYGIWGMANSCEIEEACFMDNTEIIIGVAEWKYLKDVSVTEAAPKPTPSNKRYLNLKPTVDSWKVYKTHNYFDPDNKEDILAVLNPAKFGGLSYEILKDYGNYHFKIQTQQFGIGYISGNIEKYPCTITNHPEY